MDALNRFRKNGSKSGPLRVEPTEGSAVPIRHPLQQWRSKKTALLRRRPVVYFALVVFFLLYYYRPEDFIRPLAAVPLAKIAAIFGFVALLVGMFRDATLSVPKAIKILWLLLIQMMLSIPFAIWRGGAFSTVFDKFAKGVVVALIVSMAVVTIWELRRLLWIQVSAVALVTFFSIGLRHYNQEGRLSGIQESILSNPNDLAINIAISFPLCLAFMLKSRGVRRIIWGIGLAVMALGVVLTSSRSGLLALLLSIAISVWEYGIKGKRRQLVAVTALASVLGLGVALASSHYRARLESIFLGNVEGSGDKGSLAARRALLEKSLWVAVTHPVFGVGPGCFPIVDKSWHVAHNAYTEIAAEVGFPALILFLASLWAAFENIALIRKSEYYEHNSDFKLFTQALWAGLVGYMAGSLFASTEYNLYPYFMIGYTCALVRIVSVPLPEELKDDADAEPRGLRRLTPLGRRETIPATTR
ncbi:MAG TPA: O-antigen ligase family protein [Candidatus Sulfotelmatobacter sp.]|nr:O-antigen ligase family protein [Candidatus Sulfotelmatobacter sp.]